MNKLFLGSLVSIVLYSCGAQNKAGEESISTNINSGKTYLAENVVLDNSPSSNFNLADDVIKIRPEQILLTTDPANTVGRLKSTNLKDALQNEVAPKLADILVGTWNVEHIGPSNSAIKFDGVKGQVEFTANSVILKSGGFAHAGLFSEEQKVNIGSTRINELTYRKIGDQMVAFNIKFTIDTDDARSFLSLSQVYIENPNLIYFVSSTLFANPGVTYIAILTR